MTQLALHRLKRVVDHFGERLVRTVVHLFLVAHQFVPRRHRHIDPAAIRIAFVMGVIRLLNRDVAPIDVVAKFLQPRSVIQNEIVDLI